MCRRSELSEESETQRACAATWGARKAAKRRARDAGHATGTYIRPDALEAWVNHLRRYLSWVRLVHVELSAHHGREDILPARNVKTLEPKLADVEVLSAKGLHILDSAVDFAVVRVNVRNREGTCLSCRQYGFLDFASGGARSTANRR